MDLSLGKRITKNRKRLGLTQDQLAEKLGITAQAVSKWENDLSCPDISILPKLADIFSISTDELLGREAPLPVCEATVVSDEDKNSGFSYDSETGIMDLHWDGIKLGGICLACWVLLTGILYLVSQLIPIEVSFWNILWPAFLFIFGIFGLFPKFSAFRLGCAFVGAYFLLDKLHILSIELNSGIVLAVVILIFGFALLAETIRKSKKNVSHGSKHIGNHGKIINDYQVGEDYFSYDASFGCTTQLVRLEKLKTGTISTNFGEYTVDLSAVASLDEHCVLQADCSFGELTIRVPQRYAVIADNSTSFASFEIVGQPAAAVQGTIHVNADVSFGEIRIQYI